MAKYYVVSGTLRMTVQAEDARSAALWAVHKALQQVVPMYDDEELTADDKQRQALQRGLMVLGDSVELSEIGFGRSEAQRLATYDLVTEWNQLMIALTRMENELMKTAV